MRQQPGGALGAYRVADVAERLPKNALVQKYERVQGLVLGSRGLLSLHSQPGEELSYFSGSHGLRMVQIMKRMK
jgi:hypothetical protein